MQGLTARDLAVTEEMKAALETSVLPVDCSVTNSQVGL